MKTLRFALVLLAALAAGCGRDEPAPSASTPAKGVTGTVSKGPLQGATVDFFNVDIAGDKVGTVPIASVTTNTLGQFSVGTGVLPAGVPILAVTSNGEYVDESDPEPDPVLRRRIAFGPTEHLEAVLPPDATTVAITPYSMALLKKARVQAAGVNFANVYAAVRTQATSAFGFDPITTTPADPLTGAGGSQAYGLLLGAAALTINRIAGTASPARMPGYADVIAFIDDFAAPPLDAADLDEMIRRFRNNNIGVYGTVTAPAVNQTMLAQPATVPNSLPTISNVADQTISESTTTGALSFTVDDAEDPSGSSLTVAATSNNTTLVPVTNIVLGGSGTSRTVAITPAAGLSGTATVTLTVTDSDAATASDAILLTVSGINDPPTLNAISNPTAINEDAALQTVSLSGITAGGGETQTLTVTATSDNIGLIPNPVVTYTSPAATGTLSYTPVANASGSATVTVTVSDGSASVQQTFTVTVNASNDLPVAVDDADVTSEDTPLSIADSTLTANDTDLEGPLSVQSVSNPVNGAVVLNAGTITFTPTADFSGTAGFDYTLSDGTATDIGHVTVTVSAANDAPAFGLTSYTTSVDENVPFGYSVIATVATDIDVPADTLSYSITGGNTAGAFINVFAIDAGGLITVNEPGALDYEQFTSFSLTIQADDGNGGTDTATVDIAVNDLSDTGGTGSLLPYLTGNGDLYLYDPLDPGNPYFIDSGLSTSGLVAKTLFRGDVSGTLVSDVRVARLVYIKGGQVFAVNTEHGQPHDEVQISDIADACSLNGFAEDIPNPDNSVLRVDTAGTDGNCNTSDDQTTGEAWLIHPNEPTGSGNGVQAGTGQCCGTAGITNGSGTLIAVLSSEGDGVSSNIVVNRRELPGLTTITQTYTFTSSGTGSTFSKFERALGSDDIYLRGRLSGDPTFRIYRYHVADDSLTTVYDYGVASSDSLDQSLDHGTQDASGLYIADGSAIVVIPHGATGLGQHGDLGTAPGPVGDLQQSSGYILYESHNGATGGVYSVDKLGGDIGTPGTQLAADDLTPTVASLNIVDRDRAYITLSGASFTARITNVDGSGSPTDIGDSVWAGGAREVNCDFVDHCNATPALAIVLRDTASGSSGSLEIIDPVTATSTTRLLGSLSNLNPGQSSFVNGFGRYVQITSFTTDQQTDIYFGDTEGDNPGTATTVSAVPGVDDQWLGEGGGDGGGGPGPQPPSLDGGTSQVLNINEGTGAPFSTFEFNATDPDSPQTDIIFEVVSGPGSGFIYLDGSIPVSSFSLDQVQALRVSYQHDDSETTTDSFQFALRDIDGNYSAECPLAVPCPFTVNIFPVNDPPTISALGDQSVNEDTATGVFSYTVGDPDDDPTTLIFDATSSNGSLVPNTAGNILLGGTGTNRTIQIAPEADQNGLTTITVSVTDGQYTVTDEFDLTVNPVNDEPQGASGVISVDEDVAYVLSTFDFPFSDPNDSPPHNFAGIDVITIPGSGDLYYYGVPLVGPGQHVTASDMIAGQFTYVPDPDVNGTSVTGFQFSVYDDGGGLSDFDTSPDTMLVDINAVNDGPIVTTAGPDSTNEDTARVFSTANGNAISISDVDLNEGSGQLQVEIYTAFGGTLTLSTVSGLSFLNGDGVADGYLLFTGTLADANAALEGLSFLPSQDFNGADAIYVNAYDLGNFGTGGPLGGSGSVDPLTVNPLNDAPTINYNNTMSVTEGSFDWLYSYLDATDGDSATTDVTFTLTTPPTEGQLELDGVPAAITSFTLDELQAFRITYRHFGGEVATDSFQFALEDDQAVSGDCNFASPCTFNITVNAVNDAPVVTAPPSALVTEDTPFVFSTGNGNAISASDVDIGGNDFEVYLYPFGGSTVTLSGIAGLTLLDSTTGTNDTFAHFTGTPAAVNAALEGLALQAAANSTSSFTFDIYVYDELGNNGYATIAVDVTPVNDGPVVSGAPYALTAAEGSFQHLWAAVSAADIEGDGVVYTLTSAPAEGDVQLNGVPLTVGQTFTQADINANLVIYQHAGEEQFSDAFDFTVEDTLGAPSPECPPPPGTACTVNVSITPVNDAPVVTAPASASASEDTPFVFSTGNGNAIAVADADIGGNDFEVYLFPGGGSTVTLSGIAGLTLLDSTTGTNDTFAHFSGSPAAVNAALDGLSLLPPADSTSSFSLDVYAYDEVLDQGYATIAVDVTPVNDGPVVSGAPYSLGVPEGGATQLWTAVSATDVEGDGIVYTLVSVPSEGDVQLNGVPLTIGQTFTQADLDASLVVYQHSGGEPPGDSFEFTVEDQFGEPSAECPTPPGIACTLNVTISAVNDAPVVTVPGPVSGKLYGATDVSGLSVTDADAGASTITVVLGADRGTLTLAAGPASVSDNGTSTVTLTGDQASIASTLASGIGFDATGPVLVSVTATDDQFDSDSDSFTVNVNRVELADLAGDGSGFALAGDATNDFAGRSVSSGGDFNGDGFDDFVVGAYGADPGIGDEGAAYVVFGTPGGFPASLSLSTLDGINGFRITSTDPGEQLGVAVAIAGDFNGDGYDDVLLGADRADVGSPLRTDAGIVWIVFGNSDPMPATYNLSGTGFGTQLRGPAQDAGAGAAVAYAGDVNGDGLDDVVVGAPGTLGGAAGSAYVVYGKAGFLCGDGCYFVDLANLDPDGSQGFEITGFVGSGEAGHSVAAAGDVNGDALADVLVGAWMDDRAYLVFGNPAFGSSFSVDGINGANGVVMTGQAASQAGVSVTGLDLNGDHFSDVVIGADHADPLSGGGNLDEGVAYVMLGKSDFSSTGGSVDLTAQAVSEGFAIAGAAPGDNAGAQVAGAGDLNGDGLDDLLAGAPLADPQAGLSAGTTHVLFGSLLGFPALVELSALDGLSGFHVNGANGSDFAGSVGSGGDFNGDGFADIPIGASLGNFGTGAAFMVYGRDFRADAVAIAGTNDADNGVVFPPVIGTPANDSLLGGAGYDLLDGSFGDDVLMGGSGNDQLVYDATDSLRVDGGPGFDQLQLAPGVPFDLAFINQNQAAHHARYRNFESILLNGSNQLTLGARDVLGMAGSFLRVDADSTSAVDSSDVWLLAGRADTCGGELIWPPPGPSLCTAPPYVRYEKDRVSLSIRAEADRFGIPVTFDWTLRNRDASAVQIETSLNPAFSGNGRYVVFESSSDVAGLPQAFGVPQLYRKDLQTNQVDLVSQFSGIAGDNASTRAAISHDGRYVAFRSLAANLGTLSNGQYQVLLWDATSGAITLISTDGGSEFQSTGNVFGSDPVVISADGRFIAFLGNSTGTDLNTGDNATHVWRFDTTAPAAVPGNPTLISEDAGGLRCAQANPCESVAMSSDGQWLAYSTLLDAADLGDTNTRNDIYLRNIAGNTATVVTLGADGDSAEPFISGNGQWLAFESTASNLLPAGADTNGGFDIFVYDIASPAIYRASTTNSGGQIPDIGIPVPSAPNGVGAPILSGDGRILLYTTVPGAGVAPIGATDLAPVVKVLGAPVGNDLTGATLGGHLARSGAPHDADEFGTALTFDGSTLAMHSAASNVTADDASPGSDVYAATNPVFIEVGADSGTDSDGDGLSNSAEMNFHGTNPLDVDSDDDGLSDNEEIVSAGTNPNVADSDGDDVGDGVEFAVGSDAVGVFNTTWHVDCVNGVDGPARGFTWGDPLLTNMGVDGVVAKLGTGGSDPANTIFVLYRSGPGACDEINLDTVSYVALVGSVGPNVYDPVATPANPGQMTTFDPPVPGNSAATFSDVSAVSLFNLRLTGGDGSSGGGVNAGSGANGLLFEEVLIEGNTAIDGGGLALGGAASSYTIRRSVIRNNTANNTTGPLAFGGGVYLTNGVLIVEDSQITGNFATSTVGDGMGGGLSTISPQAYLTNTTIAGNQATGVTQSGRGGGIHSGSGFISIQNSRITGNSSNGSGGGLDAGSSSNVEMLNSVIADNASSNGPGGGVNLLDIFTANIQHSMFLSNQSNRPGAGLHMHTTAISNPITIFNNLFVGNVSTDNDADGAGVEIEHNGSANPLTFNSNTIAYNQVLNNDGATFPTGGGLSISPTTSPGPDFFNNIVSFNDDADAGGTLETADNAIVDSPYNAAGNNVSEPSFFGNAAAIANGDDPQFVDGFYLNQASTSVDAGDDTAFGVGILTGSVFTTDSFGGSDLSFVDIGFHYQSPAVARIGANSQPGTLPSGCPVTVTPRFQGEVKRPGHVVALVPNAGSPTLASRTSLEPQGIGSRLARDLGDGRYQVTVSGSGAVTVDLYVDGQFAGSIPLTLTAPTACP